VTIPIEQLLNIPGIRVLSVKYDEDRIECQIESTQGYSMCHKCGQKATEFHEHGQELELRYLPLCGRQVMLRLRPKRYRCRYYEGAVTTTERADWHDAKAYAEFLLLELVNGTLQDVAKKHGVTYDVVRGVLKRYVKGEVDWSQIKTLGLLGLDEISLLKGVLTQEEYARLKGVLWALRKRREHLAPEEQALLDRLFAASPLLRRAYTLREKLTRIFDKEHSKNSGRRAIRRWMTAVRKSGLDCFDQFLTTLENRMDIITNYFISRSSIGWVEGLNNKIKVLRRRSYGIKNLGNLFRRIWLDLRGYEAFAH
jgi:transposase